MDNDVAAMAAVAVAIVMALVLAVGATLVTRDTLRKRGRWGINLQPTHCPKCDEPAPVVRTPKNLRQTLWSGFTCEHCGLEYDKWGRPVVEAGSQDA